VCVCVCVCVRVRAEGFINSIGDLQDMRFMGDLFIYIYSDYVFMFNGF